MPAENYLVLNKELWNARVEPHVKSDFYEMPQFLAGKTSLKEIELNLLGDVSGQEVLHLQCHFGQDSLSLARMGAKVTGVDFSETAIEKARKLAADLQISAEFICSDVYTLPNILHRKFDKVFTSYGVIGWLPDVQKWAKVISHFLKPGGELIFVEFHPAVWMFDNDFTHVQYSYFNRQEIIEEEKGTYADAEADIKHTSVSWNHAIGEVTEALTDNGLQLLRLQEYDYAPYPFVKDHVAAGEGKWHIKGMEGKLPLVYSIKAKTGIGKPSNFTSLNWFLKCGKRCFL